MTKDFIKKLKLYGIVDTKKYRYRIHSTSYFERIERIRIEKLDTVAALDEWEIVKVLHTR